MYGQASDLHFDSFPGLPEYTDFKEEKCKKNSANREHTSILVILMLIVMKAIFSK